MRQTKKQKRQRFHELVVKEALETISPEEKSELEKLTAERRQRYGGF